MADRFYVNFPLSPGEVVLQGPEVHHLATVRRFQVGDQVTLFNGTGAEFPSSIRSVGKKTVTLQVQSAESINRELASSLEVASAVPKGDREEFLIEKLTELGVTRFVPLITERSVVIPKVERLQRTAIEASKQCGRNVLMQIATPTAWPNYLKQEHPSVCWIAHTSASRMIDKAARPNVITIGPEGGFTDEEVGLAIAQGWRPVSLGPRTLRIETAAIALAAIVTNW